jgi:hypothetical protein
MRLFTILLLACSPDPAGDKAGADSGDTTPTEGDADTDADADADADADSDADADADGGDPGGGGGGAFDLTDTWTGTVQVDATLDGSTPAVCTGSLSLPFEDVRGGGPFSCTWDIDSFPYSSGNLEIGVQPDATNLIGFGDMGPLSGEIVGTFDGLGVIEGSFSASGSDGEHTVDMVVSFRLDRP